MFLFSYSEPLEVCKQTILFPNFETLVSVTSIVVIVGTSLIPTKFYQKYNVPNILENIVSFNPCP